MTTPDPTRRTRNIIGIMAIVLLVVFYLIEFAGYINFFEWLGLVIVTFVIANFAIRQIRKRQT
ncbi:MAG TPA: hypothetical protein VMD05_01060 [Candidatus Nanoarchaeia archaeon]|nr:hypothetical protein [Candidatus Nanoarchaeia archaeon]